MLSLESRPPKPQRTVAMVIQRFRPVFSGQAVQVEMVCNALAPRGVRSVVLTPVRGRSGGTEAVDGWEIRRLRADLLPGSRDRSRLWMPLWGLRAFAALLRLRPHVVHVHGVQDGLFGARAYARLTGTPVVVEMTLMGDDDPISVRDRSWGLARMRWSSYRRADAWVAMSEAFREPYERAGLPPERLHLIPQGVDTERFAPATPEQKAETRRRLGIPEGAPVAAFVGSLTRRKGVDLLLQAWSIVAAEVPGAHLVLAGPREFGSGSRAQIELDQDLAAITPSARERVHLTGRVDAPEQFLGAADLFTFPSRREGFGTVIVEAMACGLPVIVARMGGITDMILRDGDGIVVPPEDPVSLARAMTEILTAPDRGERMGRQARERAVEAFSIEDVADRYRLLYDRLVEGGRD